MKKYAILTSVLVLAACGGGSGGGANGAPGKSAYEIWLDAGNTGTEQDFLDSLVANTGGSGTDSEVYWSSFLQQAQSQGGYKINKMSWPRHGDFYRLVKEDSDYSGYNVGDPTDNLDSASKDTYTYNEKELNLANYGVRLAKTQTKYEFDTSIETEYRASSWFHNREGLGANVYTPATGTVFKGGTMAYLSEEYFANTTEPVFIKGDAEYTYNPTNPKLVLDFDNYYKFVLQNGQGTTVSGTNNTGYTRFDIVPGTQISSSNDVPYKTGEYPDIGYLKKGSTEEVVGEYDILIIDHGEDNTPGYAKHGNFYINGAFGGTKQ